MTKGQRLREQRERMHYGLTELAEKVGISKQTLYKYENDIVTNIPSDKIEELSDILNTSPAYIMGWYDEEDVAFTQKTSYEEKYANIIEAYAKATPEIQKAVELILKANQPDP